MGMFNAMVLGIGVLASLAFFVLLGFSSSDREKVNTSKKPLANRKNDSKELKKAA